MVFDSTYNEVTDRLRQNIVLVDVTTPFIYILSALVGFITSYALTRRRMPEFAVIRSIGINKKDVFSGVLMEQTVLCSAGAAMAFILFLAVRGQAVWPPPVLFTLCYALGSILSAKKAAGADVLKLLRERE
jgi:ABC-type antimicrobial peptide transport system permease subunit